MVLRSFLEKCRRDGFITIQFVQKNVRILCSLLVCVDLRIRTLTNVNLDDCSGSNRIIGDDALRSYIQYYTVKFERKKESNPKKRIHELKQIRLAIQIGLK